MERGGSWIACGGAAGIGDVMPRSKRQVPLPPGRPVGPPHLFGACVKCYRPRSLILTDNGPMCQECVWDPILTKSALQIDDPDPYC